MTDTAQRNTAPSHEAPGAPPPATAPSPAATAPGSKKILVAAALLFAAFLFAWLRKTGPAVSGALRVDGVSHAAQSCVGAGGGAEVFLEGNHGLVISSSDGRAQVTFDGDSMARCDTARVRVGEGRAGGSRSFAGYPVTSGSITLDCRTARGVHVEGQLEFDRCRQ